jgi:hypothetical protein
MRPPPTMQSYLEHVAKQGVSEQSAPNSVPNNAVHAAQREVQKFKALQERRAQLVSELQNIEAQMNKTQGGLEVFQAMGVLKSPE